ncbi:MAG: PIG-L family deacetylase [Planctomycetaceae bacterium]|nr:PIG-L family deacetylase [Planctomycetaceae bacterium]
MHSRLGLLTRFILAILLGCFAVSTWADDKAVVVAKPQLDRLVIAPHSDDEAIGCAAVMIQALAQGERVGVIIITASDGFPRAAAAVVKKPIDALQPADFFQLATIRERHTLQAMKKIGIAADDLLFLGYPDSGLATIYNTNGSTAYRQPFTEKSATYAMVTRDYHSLAHGQPAPYTKAALTGDLAEIIKQRRPREIYVTHEIDTHADHRATCWFVRDAARQAGFDGQLLTYVVHGDEPTQPPARILKLDPATLKTKRALLEGYQMGLSPVHDDLADHYLRPEERFWPMRVTDDTAK